MIDVKEAVQIAKAKEMLDQRALDLEEIERESYKDGEVWSITLSLPRTHLNSLAQYAAPIQYKRFLIDADTGELVAMKLRDVA